MVFADEIYKSDDGRTFIAISKTFKKDYAITVANKYFKKKKSDLEIRSGKVTGNTLEIGVKGDRWVISRREKA